MHETGKRPLSASQAGRAQRSVRPVPPANFLCIIPINRSLKPAFPLSKVGLLQLTESKLRDIMGKNVAPCPDMRI